MKRIVVTMLCVVMTTMHASNLDPFQQELMNKLKKQMSQEAKPAAAKPGASALPKSPAQPVQPKLPSQIERKETVAQQEAGLTNKFWGTAAVTRKVWDELQALLVQHKNGTWDDWKQKEYDRLAQLRDNDARVSSQLGKIAPDYIIVYGELKDKPRELLLTNMNTIASALFGNAALSNSDRALVNNVIESIRKLLPQNHAFPKALETVLAAPRVQPAIVQPKPAAPEPKKAAEVKKEAELKVKAPDKESNGKAAAAVKKQQIEECLEKIREKYREDFEEQRQLLMGFFFDITERDPSSWNALLKYGRPKVLDRLQQEVAFHVSLDPESPFHQMFTRLLQEANVDPKTISLVLSDDVELGANDVSIHMQLDYFKNQTHNEIEATAMHEIQHIRFQDASILGLMRQLLQFTNVETSTSFLQLWSYFIEKRADTFAALTSLDRARGTISYFKTSRPHHQFKEGVSHQHDAQRVANIETIYHQMLSCYEQ